MSSPYTLFADQHVCAEQPYLWLIFCSFGLATLGAILFYGLFYGNRVQILTLQNVRRNYWIFFFTLTFISAVSSFFCINMLYSYPNCYSQEVQFVLDEDEDITKEEAINQIFSTKKVGESKNTLIEVNLLYFMISFLLLSIAGRFLSSHARKVPF